MKHKDLVNIAKVLGEAELVIQNSTNSEEKDKAKNTVIDITSKIESLDDLLELDTLIQEYINNRSKENYEREF